MSRQFPMMVYTSPGPHECPGGSYGFEQVKDEKELTAALEVGFFLTLKEALNCEPDEEFAGPEAQPEAETSRFKVS